MQPKIAVLDDERRMLEAIALVLGDEDVRTFAHPQEALAELARERYDVLLTDLKMPAMSGLEVLQKARELDSDLQVVLMTAHASIPTAVAAMREGAFEYIEKPFDNDELRALVARAAELARLKRENRYLRSEVGQRHDPGRVVAESPAMQRVLALVRKVAKSRSTVLITGESGTGKEVIARSVHFGSDRLGRPFVAVNAKALASGVLESELFGHEKGAFTGAHRARPGIFERAHGGTLFLDEIGEISADFQAKLLRVLEEREVRRVGGSTDVAVDVRVVTATNRDLKAEVAAGRFREDLYFRLNVVPVHLPPLRERAEDVLALAQRFLERANADLPRDAVLTGFTSDAEAVLRAYNWPGNVRELENAVERGALLTDGPRVDVGDLLLDTSSAPPAPGGDMTLKEVMDGAAERHIREVLAAVDGSRVEAAQRLGVERTTLYRLMRRLGFE